MILRSSSPSRSFYEQGDSFQPLLIEELLKGQTEWRNIQDIIRVSFRALTDTVKVQGQAIRDLEKSLSVKVSRSDFVSSLAAKIDFSDFSENFANIQSSLDTKLSHFQVESIISNQISDLVYSISNKASIEQLASLDSQKLSKAEFGSTAEDLYERLNLLHHEINRLIQVVPSNDDFNILKNEYDYKIEGLTKYLKELEENHFSLIAKKTNRSDFEQAIARKNEEVNGLRLAVELKAESEWTEKSLNILKDTLNQQQAKIESLETFLQETSLKSKENSEKQTNLYSEIKLDLEKTKNTFTQHVSTKADARDLEKAFNIIMKKADTDTMHEHFSIQRKHTNESITEKLTDVKSILKKTEENLGEKVKSTEDYSKNLENQIKEAKHILKLLESDHKNTNQETVSNFSKELEEIKLEFKSEIQRLQKSFEDLSTEKANREEFKESFNKVSHKLNAKAEISDFEKSLKKSQKELVSSFQTIRDDYKIYFTKLENQMSAKFDQLVTRNELRSAISEKADSSQISRLMSFKMNIEDITKFRGEIESALIEIRNKALKSDLDAHVASTKIAIEEISKELVSKAYIKDLCTLLDMKASIDDVNSALMEIHKELDTKVSVQTQTMQLNEQQALNSIFCSENTVARWIWRNGELANGFSVPWEIQCINTAPDNFVWEPDVTNIVVVAPGLYEINFGFYCKKKPTVQLLVNGEIILSAVNNASYVIHHSSGRLKNASSSSGTISGLTLIDFIALPPRAKISLSYNGDRNCEGFLALKKL